MRIPGRNNALAITTASVLLMSSSRAFRPIIAPRFDLFCEKIVGPWSEDRSDGGAAKNVEEVMCSCGGAVQGIREINGLYLNRADDGFIFYEDGSYSWGPTKLVEGNEGGNQFTTCISVTKSHRVFIESGMGLTDLSCIALTCANKATGAGSVLIKQRHPNDNPLHQLFSEIRCSMPSPTQPWMLQRAKFEKLFHGGGENPQDEYLEDQELADSLNVWTHLETHNSDGEKVFSVGVTSTATGSTKAFRRVYNSGGSLVSVSRLLGSCDRKHGKNCHPE